MNIQYIKAYDELPSVHAHFIVNIAFELDLISESVCLDSTGLLFHTGLTFFVTPIQWCHVMRIS